MTGEPAAPRQATVLERGRAKAYRPLPDEARTAAVARGIASFERGEFYLAHEELEPAWMAAADPAERALLGGLIKVAAAYVHAARGNPLGVRTNLRGARVRLVDAEGCDGRLLPFALDVPELIRRVDDRLATIEIVLAGTADPVDDPVSIVPPPHAVAGPPQVRRRAPLAIAPIRLPRGAHG